MRRTPSFLLATGVVLAVALVAGCGSDSSEVSSDTTDTTAADSPDTTASDDAAPTGGSGLAGHTYVSESITEDGAARPLAGEEPIRLEFSEDGDLGATGGCNAMSGAFEEDGGVLVVEDLAMTQMACEPATLMEQDDWLSTFLQSGPQVALDGETLTLTSGGTAMVLTEEAPATDVELTGVTWTLEAVFEGGGDDGTASSVPVGVTATLEFADDGTVAVHAGCNSGSAGYEATADTIAFEPLALTRMACEEDAATIEAAVTTTLDGEVTYLIEGDVLSLTTDTGAGLQYRAGT
jgi:heat shock protein HslJ